MESVYKKLTVIIKKYTKLFVESINKGLVFLKSLNKQQKNRAFQAGGIAVILILLIIIIGPKEKTEKVVVEKTEAYMVQAKIEEFGRRQALVSLTAPKDIQAEVIAGHYSYYATSDLIKKWQKDLSIAPGRRTADPWPEKIEVDTLEKLEDGSYVIKGRLIERTSNPEAKNGIAGEYPLEITAKKINDRWMITYYERENPNPEE